MTIDFTPNMLEELKVACKRAEVNNKEVFELFGAEFLVSYAKYVIQHLETRFKNDR